jgi:hypothetical protein
MLRFQKGAPMPTTTTRKMTRTIALAAIAAGAVAIGLATPAMASAKPVAYSGMTAGGYEITFKKTGRSLKGLRASVPTTCVPTGSGAVARGGSEIFEPPARVPLGREVTQTAVQEPTMYYNEVTKNYRITAKARRNGIVTGRLHVNFSFQTIGSDAWGLRLVGFICQGDDTFKARPVRK